MDRSRDPTLHPERRRRQARSATIALSVALLLGLALSGAGVFGAFSSTSASPSNTISAAPDFIAPTTSRSVIAKTAGGTPGFIKQGGTYFVYADATDAGNPASGISSVTANASAFDTGVIAGPLSSGSFSIGGIAYNYRSASLTANTPLAANTYSYTVTATDVAGNSSVKSGLSVIVDNTVPAGSGIQTPVAGSIVGQAQLNDAIAYTYSEPIDPNSVLAGWTGAATNVTVRINNNTPTNDQVQVFNSANTAQLPLGNVNLGRTDYTTANITFGASGTKSSMTMSGNTITVTLGTASAAGTTAAATGTMIWTPSATATDRAGNASSITNVTESGTADKDF
jgi:hypothetical protein